VGKRFDIVLVSLWLKLKIDISQNSRGKFNDFVNFTSGILGYVNRHTSGENPPSLPRACRWSADIWDKPTHNASF